MKCLDQLTNNRNRTKLHLSGLMLQILLIAYWLVIDFKPQEMPKREIKSNYVNAKSTMICEPIRLLEWRKR